MPVMDEFQEERETIKNAPFRKKLRYFWDYYKWHAIAVITIICVLVSLINHYINRRELSFYSAMINADCLLEDLDAYGDAFGEYCELNMKKQEMYFDTSLRIDMQKRDENMVTSTQKIMVYLSASDIDTMITTNLALQHYAYMEALTDMEKFLTKEEKEKYNPRYYYIDRAIAKKQKELSDNLDTTTVLDYPENPLDPTTMEDPVAVGVVIEKDNPFYGVFRFEGNNPEKNPAIFSVVVNTKRSDLCHKLFEYIFTY